ncbi:hypothetical protein [Robertmurraya sp.]|uniref:hypothetical protein n=1 Tax=Robertmurraya sp. TaxID=2837525 RepID=UPI003703800E
MKAFTDYPILELGDISGEEAPIREVKILHYDGDKRCKVIVEGVQEEIKTGYLYKAPARYDEAYEKDLVINTQYVKNEKGHFPSSKAAQITKSWIVYGPNYSPSSGLGPFYYRFLRDAWNKAKSLGEGAECVQNLKVRNRDGSGTWTSGGVVYEICAK